MTTVDGATIARRRRRALGALAVGAGAIGLIVGGGGGANAPETASEPPSVCNSGAPGALARIAGQAVIVRMEDRAKRDLLRAARRGGIGGVILFPDPEIDGKSLGAEIKRLRAAALAGGNPPLLVSIDQEGGIVERLPALAPALSPSTLAQNDDPNAARLEGRATGFQLRELGIDVNLAPVLDVPSSVGQFMTPRAFGTNPAQVGRLGLAFASGLRREGVAATAKHFPGLGRAIENTDFAPTTIEASRRELRKDIEPFAAAIAEGFELVMASSGSYPGLGSAEPAVMSREVLTDLLRGELGFGGVVITDDLLAPAIAGERSRADAAIAASAAGADLLLFAARETGSVAPTLAAAVASGDLDEAALRASCERILTLKDRLKAGGDLSASGGT